MNNTNQAIQTVQIGEISWEHYILYCAIYHPGYIETIELTPVSAREGVDTIEEIWYTQENLQLQFAF